MEQLLLQSLEKESQAPALPADIEVTKVEPLLVPELDAERCLVWMRPRSQRPLGPVTVQKTHG